jgi:hypothetical protein
MAIYRRIRMVCQKEKVDDAHFLCYYFFTALSCP